MSRKLFLSLIAVFIFSLSLTADTVIEEIVARVNDPIITRSDLVKSREELQQELKQQSISPTDPRAKDKEKDM
ncbi:MAG TPA: hypothetical protein VM912_10045, partial [Terriglobales bacterium]|nr:hypothetical protein [Terriglobales bacterium]